MLPISLEWVVGLGWFEHRELRFVFTSFGNLYTIEAEAAEEEKCYRTRQEGLF